MNHFGFRKIKSALVALSVVAAAAVTTTASAARLTKVTPEMIKKIEKAVPKNAAKPKKARKVLVFTKCNGFVHSCIDVASKAFEIMGKKTGAYDVVISDNMDMFLPENIKQFDAILLNNTTKLGFQNPKHQKGLLEFVKNGKGIIGIHAAADNFYNWKPGAEMMGGVFNGHPWTANGTWSFKLNEPNSPIAKPFNGKGFKARDEIYQLREPFSRDNYRVILSLDFRDANTANRGGQRRTDRDYSVAHVRKYGKGRAFYSGLGHNEDIYWNPQILAHYLAGIQYALGDLELNDTPNPRATKKGPFVDLVALKDSEGQKNRIWLEDLVRTTKKADYPALEQRLLASFFAKGATRACKKMVCKQLRICGSEASVKALKDQLTNPELSFIVRYAIQNIASKEVAPAMREAFGKTNDLNVKIGLITSLGVLRDVKSIELAASLIDEKDRNALKAALIAFEQIPAVDSYKYIKQIGSKHGNFLKIQYELSLVNCLKNLVKTAELSSKARVGFINELVSFAKDQASLTRVRVSALNALAECDVELAQQTALGLLDCKKLAVATNAANFFRLTQANIPFAKKISNFGSLNDRVQVLLLEGIANRADSTGLALVRENLNSRNARVRNAALKAIAVVGQDADVDTLIALAKKLGGNERHVMIAIAAMKAAGTNDQLIKLLGSSSDKEVVINAVRARNIPVALPALCKLAKSGDGKIANAALSAIGSIATEKELNIVLPIVCEVPTDNARRAVIEIYNDSTDSKKAAGEIIAAMKTAKSAAKICLIRALSAAQIPMVLDALQEELKANNPAIAKAVAETLNEWKNRNALPTYEKTIPQLTGNFRFKTIKKFLDLLIKSENVPFSNEYGLSAIKNVVKWAEGKVSLQKRAIKRLAYFPSKEAIEYVKTLQSNPKFKSLAGKMVIKIKKILNQPKITSSHNNGDTRKMLDGNNRTWWTTRTPMRKGMWLKFDFRGKRKISEIDLDTQGHSNDVAGTYEVYTSKDGVNWGKPIFKGKSSRFVTKIKFRKPIETRYLKIVNTAKSSTYWWTVEKLIIK